jgi:hypothetical protein
MPRAPLTVFKWEAPEFRHYPKNPAWYITMFLMVGLLAAYLVYVQDWFGAVCMFILAILIFFFARQTPEFVTMEISDRGVHINGDLIPYNRIKQFWIIDDHEHKVLNIETTAYLNHLLAIELEEEDADEIRDFLIDILPENPKVQPMATQKIAHRFKF